MNARWCVTNELMGKCRQFCLIPEKEARIMSCMVLLNTLLVCLIQLACANVLDVACINFNPVYDTDSSASYAAILNGADVTSTVSFQRSVVLDTGVRSPEWCLQGDDVTDCELPQGSTIGSSGTLTFQDTAQDKFGVYGCRAERHNWTTTTSTMFIRNDAHFNPEHFTMTVSLDEEVRLVMNPGSPGGTGSLGWRLNHEGGGQSDASSGVSGNKLYISKVTKADHAGIHHYFYEDQPDRGGLLRLIVRACLDNLWGPDCQYTCPTCYNGGVCDDVSGRCVCPPGFSGDHCQIACEAGKFGQNCRGSCLPLEPSRTDCSGALFCLADPYGCSCAAGWTGLACDQACPTDSYGAGCTQTCHCESSGSCDSVTGACSNGCEDGWIGDQCQVTVLDMQAMLRRGGVDDVNGDNFLGIFMIGDDTVTTDPSLKYYIGREVDTGPGEIGHGAISGTLASGITASWVDTGLPQDTTFIFRDHNAQDSLRAQIDKDNGGDARVGAYRMAVNYRGWTERTVLLNQYRGDSNSEVWPEKLSSTVGIGETVTLHVLTESSVDTASLRWRHNGGSEITEWNGRTSVIINDVRKSDEGIYECYVESNRETGRHAIMNLIVRGCPSSKYGFNCSQDCPVCYAGGVCHDVTGECVCRPGFQGDDCETSCGDNNWGKACTVVCSSSNPGCSNRLFAAPNPVGLSCMNGYAGNRCQSVCDASHFGTDCEMDCNCDGNCDRVSGCQGTCSRNYEGTYCQALRWDLDCPSGYFGTLCNYHCHCNGSVACQRSNGHCPNGVPCAEGWAGSDCQQALPRLLYSPWVSDVTNDSVLLIWNAWTDGFDYGNGPVHSYQADYTWADDVGNTGQSDQPIIIFGDSTADVTGLFGFRDYDFYVSIRREVEGQPVAGVRINSVNSVRTNCGGPLLAPEILSATFYDADRITIRWKIPEIPSSSWLQCNSSVYSYNLTYWSANDPSNAQTVPVDGSGDIASETIYNLKLCTEYVFSVVVINSVNLAGPADQTTAVTDLGPPEPVDNADVTSDSYNHMTITWSAPSSQCGAPSYNVSRMLLLIDQCDESMANNVTWTVTDDTSIEYNDLRPYSTYQFNILAHFGNYDAESPYIVTYVTTQSVPEEVPRNIAVDSSEKSTLVFTWDSPSCGKRNGIISYSYTLSELSSEAPADPRTGTQKETIVRFDELPHNSTFNFIVCSLTSVGSGLCSSVVAKTVSNDDQFNCFSQQTNVSSIILGAFLAISTIYSLFVTYFYIDLRKREQPHKQHELSNVYNDLKLDSIADKSTYEEIASSHYNMSARNPEPLPPTPSQHGQDNLGYENAGRVRQETRIKPTA